MTDTPPTDLPSAATRLYEHLHATAERPVERRASRLLGEAEAVADDMRGCPPAVMVERAAIVADLLAAIDDTGDATADEHLALARELVEDIRQHEE